MANTAELVKVVPINKSSAHMHLVKQIVENQANIIEHNSKVLSDHEDFTYEIEDVEYNITGDLALGITIGNVDASAYCHIKFSMGCNQADVEGVYYAISQLSNEEIAKNFMFNKA